MIEPYAILLKKTAASRESAIKIAAQPLVNHKKITLNYVQAMIDVLSEMGTYMVISPGVAIVHARPSSKVIENCVSLATFDPPILFGHPNNDPVDVVFVIAAKEAQRHLEAMRDIAKAMCRDNFLETMQSATDAQEVLEYFYGGEK